MQAHTPLNGSYTSKGNYLWGGALTLAWKQLAHDIIKEPIRIKTQDKNAIKIADNYNNSSFNTKMLSQSCYYARAGFGNETVNKINEEVAKKFPGKTTEKLQANLSPSSIISYAYFLKNMKFNNPFTKADVIFNGKQVPGFEAKNPAQRNQIHVYNYSNQDNFTIQLVTKAENDEIFILKSQKNLIPEQVLEKIEGLGQKNSAMGSKDLFQMPKIGLNHRRDVSQLMGVYLQNQKFKQYYFQKIYEIIKLDIDETGVKVENQGVIMMNKCKALGPPPQIKRLILDKPFWIVMRQKQCQPYFVAFINEVNDK